MQNAAIRNESAYQPSPSCPHCGTSMRFARSFPNFGARDPLQTFDCMMCGLSVTKTVPAEALELTGHAAA
jgi:hypothetical protein